MASPSIRSVVVLLGRGMPKRDEEARLEAIRCRLPPLPPDERVEIAYLEMTAPALADTLAALDAEGVAEAMVVPCFVPFDRNVRAWLPRAISRRLRDGGSRMAVRFAPALDQTGEFSDAVARSLAAARLAPSVTDVVRPMALRPGSSRIPPHARHVLVCVGPRCVEAGAWATLDRFRQAVTAAGLHTGPDRVLITRSGCLHPCNMAPVAVVYPEGTWYPAAHEAAVDRIVAEHLVGGTAVAMLAATPGEALTADPDDLGDADDPVAGAAAGALVCSGFFARRGMHDPDAAAVFGTLRNVGSGPLRITAISSPQADDVHLHDPLSQEAGLPFDLAPAGTLTFAPGRLHAMLRSAMARRSEGETLDILVHVEDRQPVPLTLPIHALRTMPHA